MPATRRRSPCVIAAIFVVFALLAADDVHAQRHYNVPLRHRQERVKDNLLDAMKSQMSRDHRWTVIRYYLRTKKPMPDSVQQMYTELLHEAEEANKRRQLGHFATSPRPTIRMRVRHKSLSDFLADFHDMQRRTTKEAMLVSTTTPIPTRLPDQSQPIADKDNVPDRIGPTDEIIVAVPADASTPIPTLFPGQSQQILYKDNVHDRYVPTDELFVPVQPDELDNELPKQPFFMSSSEEFQYEYPPYFNPPRPTDKEPPVTTVDPTLVAIFQKANVDDGRFWVGKSKKRRKKQPKTRSGQHDWSYSTWIAIYLMVAIGGGWTMVLIYERRRSRVRHLQMQMIRLATYDRQRKARDNNVAEETV